MQLHSESFLNMIFKFVILRKIPGYLSSLAYYQNFLHIYPRKDNISSISRKFLYIYFMQNDI
jgi:hypothetical protein